MNFLYLHREFLWGVLAGALVEAIIILSRRWAWDRVLWIRWFSHQ
jgi:hypothetical protein